MFANLLYLLGLGLLSPVIAFRMLRHGRYRRGIGQKLLGLSAEEGIRLRGSTSDRELIWMHAVSVGEVNLLPGIVARMEQASEAPVAIVISSSTDTGYDLAVKHFGADRVFFCPLDFTWAVRRTLRNLMPSRLVLAELELWPNLIQQASRGGCEVLVINGRLSDRSSSRYQQFDQWTKATFGRLSWVGCQDQASMSNFAACGVPAERLEVTGSLKFDDAPTSRETTDVQERATWAGLDPWHRVWIVGSTQAGEEEMALDVYQDLLDSHSELRLILVPRHKERFDEVAELIRAKGLQAHRRSRDASLDDQDWDSDRVILVDTIGELRHWWGVGQIATVGGSFGDRGGQNMLEPAGYGNAVSFGPNTRNFRQIADWLLEAGGAVRLADAAEMKAFVDRCLCDVPAADALGRAAKELVAKHRGATERTVARMVMATPEEQTQRRAG
ncbi:MAG: 3-deoxy-D-manno-octulosonic acid transferase [Rubripirellula sp.]